jgi:hypothetical protein
MPWVRRSIHSNRMYGIGVAIAALMMGVLLGYQWWGSTAAVVAVVEKELAGSMARLSALERRVMTLESSLGTRNGEAARDESASGTSIKPVRREPVQPTDGVAVRSAQ